VIFSRTERLIRVAKRHIRKGNPIPLDLYAALDAAGVNINELERNARNG
jgi:hypothetical protein